MSIPLTSTDWVLAILAALPGRQLIGTDRFHALCQLLTAAGANMPMEFAIHRFTVCSDDLTSAIRMLRDEGRLTTYWVPNAALSREEKCYRLSLNGTATTPQLTEQDRHTLRRLIPYSTLSLTLASTLAFFLKRGQSREDVIGSLRIVNQHPATQGAFAEVEEILAHCNRLTPLTTV
jgi:hypothetical protein